MDILTTIGTLISAIAAAVAAIASWRAVHSWRAQAIFENRRSAIVEWMSSAASFQGKLKQIYEENVQWPKDKEVIEGISKDFWELVAKWPAVQTSLRGDSRERAEEIWSKVSDSYNNYMHGSGNLSNLRDTIAEIYNNKQLQELASPHGGG